MTTEGLKKYIEKTRKKNGKDSTIDTETGLTALEQVAATTKNKTFRGRWWTA